MISKNSWRLGGAALALFVLIATPATATELDEADPALKFIPAEASIYQSMLRNREKLDIVLASRAWKTLMELPVVRMGWGFYQTKVENIPESGPAQFHTAMQDPQVQDLLKVLADMVSDEIFVYSDQSLVDFLELAQEVNGAVRYGPTVVQLSGQAEGLDPEELQARLLMATLAENTESLRIPNLIFGFKVSDPQRVIMQLAKLELIAGFAVGQVPELKGSLKRTKVGPGEYLVLTLNGKMIPWEEVPVDEMKQLESRPGDLDKIISKIKEETFVVAIGLRDDFLLVSIGPSTDCLAGLGSGPLLVDRAEMKPLAKYADRRVSSVGYASASLNQLAGGSKESLDKLKRAVDDLVPLSKLDQTEQDQIRHDAGEMIDDLKEMAPEVGAISGLAFLTDRGIEGYTYNWGEHDPLDGSKPLTLLDHVGGDPVLALIARSKVSPDDYETLVQWAETLWYYLERYGLPALDDDDREDVRKLVVELTPLAARFDMATREMLLPALADGQAGLVVDAELKSKHFAKSLPATEEAMPMLEPALLLGISDAARMDEALTEYWFLYNAVVEAIRDVEDDVPDLRIPEPAIEETDLGKLYLFTLPEECGADKQIAPCLGLSDSVLAFAMSQDHLKRLLKATPLTVGGVLSKTEEPLAMAGLFNWSRLMTAAVPWVDMAIEKASRRYLSGGTDNEPEVHVKLYKDQSHRFLDILRTIRGLTSKSYLEDGVLVEHCLLEIRDLD